MKRYFFTKIFFVLSAIAVGQNVGIGTLSPDPSSLLELQSTDKGFITPRLTTIQRDAISNPAEGLLIFNTNTKCFNFFKLYPDVMVAALR